MKKYLIYTAAAAFISLSPATFAARPLTSGEASQLRPVGTVSAQGIRSLDDLEAKLAEKAREKGAKGYFIHAAGGKNLMYGSAIIYK
ncbi:MULTISPECIES: DUF1471 family periplasmic protein McbA [Tenebrionibacter/Tenebrionicola group]|jgi:MqsR-controlled colanic acid and biofilm protein A|uniref:DUF1471 domain-containing protein n=2 Tax=Tenebrionibacter/Tenebrionicola group TaxID=2969848 RepID=A0A8K0XYH4_9ENTR|nr:MULTISPECIES: DUF1471 family periplasmic protein McbA [Tenebrionibacter/Tenebrionicola group]MBK4714559.1 DUF1471 domain-containing protein [Tenebrionibacter intestinalis]MBV4412281.1 DUF1471 domain-containing protein [Tenebrionicola larvae]MBV5095387.1 DUF1471 domain-containing protein [Tenebrionicola larvae]